MVTTERARIDADGNLSAFATVSGTSLKLGRQGQTSVVASNLIWILGGLDSIAAGDAEVTQLRADGTLTPFMLPAGLGLPAPRRDAAAEMVGSSLLVVGGHGSTGSGDFADVLSGAVPAAGVLQPFAPLRDVALHEARHGHASVTLGNRMYVIGGQNSGGFLGSIEDARLGN